MAFTTAHAMTQFVETISLTDAQKNEVSSKVVATREYMSGAFPASSDLPVKRAIMIGSADRGTLIRPLMDVDVMAEFTNKDGVFEKYRLDSGAFLQRIRTALNAKTSIQHIGARGQAVRLFYQSGAHVDIAPVFMWSGSGYALPSGTGSWITTDPEAQATWYSQRKATIGANLTPVVKLAKRWNKVHSSRFSSYHLEVMVATMFGSVGANHRDALKCFFEWAPNYLSVSDPAGHYGSLDDYLTWDSKQSILSRLSEALARARKALDAEAGGDHAEAKRLWKIELGDEFPTS